MWCSPPTGWVTVLAGLLARGSVRVVRPSQFPSGQTWTNARRLQLRGQPRFHLHRTDDPCSLLPPRCNPRNQHAATIHRADAKRQDSINAGMLMQRRCCAAATTKRRRCGEFRPACGPRERRRKPAAAAGAGYAYCQLRDTITVSTYKTRPGCRLRDSVLQARLVVRRFATLRPGVPALRNIDVLRRGPAQTRTRWPLRQDTVQSLNAC